MSRATAHLPSSALRSPLTGRTAEIALLRDHLDRAFCGQPSVVLIGGDAGIGKTRLVTEALSIVDRDDPLVTWGHCYESDQTRPYAPLDGIMHSLIEATGTRSSIATDLTDGGIDIDPQHQQHRRFQKMTESVQSAARARPVIIVIEDLHWCDESTLHFLLYLTRRLASQPIALLTTYRIDENHPPLRQILPILDREACVTEIRLQPLRDSDIDVLVQAALAPKPSIRREFLAAISEIAEGNPFFVEEIVKSLAEDNRTNHVNGTIDQLRIPRSIDGLIQTRLSRLSSLASQAVVVAAVAGRQFDFDLLKDVLSCNEAQLLEAMKELIAAYLVVEASDDQFVFRHALTRHAILNRLLQRERRATHRAIVDALGSRVADTAIADIAYHSFEAQDWERTVTYAQRAGEHALALGAPRAAIEQYSRSIEAADRFGAPPSAHNFRARGLALATIGDLVSAQRDLETALAIDHRTGDQRAVVGAMLDLGLFWSASNYELAGSNFQQAVSLAETLDDPSLHARCLNRLGNWLANTGQPARGRDAHLQALDVFQTVGDPGGIATTHDLLSIANLHCGDILTATDHITEAIRLFRAGNDLSGLASALVSRACITSPLFTETVYTGRGIPEACISDLAEALRLVRSLDWVPGETFALRIYGTICALFGQLGPAVRYGHEALRLATEIDHQQWMTSAHDGLGIIRLALLQPALAVEHFETALDLARTVNSDWWIGNTSASLAMAHLINGEPERAEQTLAETSSCHNRTRNVAERRIMLAWGHVSLAKGQPERALRHAEDLLATVPGQPATQTIPELLALRGEALAALGDLGSAESDFEAALDGAVDRHQLSLCWQIHRSIGHVRRRMNRSVDAELAYQAARQLLKQLATTIDDDQLRAHYLAAGLSSMPKERRQTPGPRLLRTSDGLTRRELEVAQMIAAGSTNRAIAEHLFISEGTVRTHVKAILRKLDVHSRTQIATWLLQQDSRVPGSVDDG